ncbi:TPA: hypothetical protein DCZ17_01705 [Candidatus Collierbacteria bacterium]|nr:hypothetical protein [Candidatus Collierbacteria bacterium]
MWGDEDKAPSLTDFACYNLVNFTLLPHWGSDFFRDSYLGKRLSQIYVDSLPPFIVCNDHQYVEVKDDWYQIVDVTKA